MKKTGILLHISSLPKGYGIGNFGKAAYEFVDFLAETNQRYWQILPLNPVGYGYSPYQSESTFAINPLFIDLDALLAEGMLYASDLPDKEGLNSRNVDYEKVFALYSTALNKAFFNGYLQLSKDIADFMNEHKWLKDYAVFMTLKEKNGNAIWQECVIKSIESEKERLDYYCFVQYIAYKQYLKLKEYANSKDILIIGDIPIYVSEDSADVWSNPQEFYLDKAGRPTKRAGVPPDYFSADGQLWGNPLYNYKKMRKNKFIWWRNRLKNALTLYDIVRIDHFRAFAAYWAVTGCTAKEGQWIRSAGRELLSSMSDFFTADRIIAEDLGVITPAVDKLRQEFGFAGMKVLQFAFGKKTRRHKYLPHNYPENCVAYSGTHDNPTLAGFINNAGVELENIKNYYKTCNSLLLCDIMLKSLVNSKAGKVIFPAQDILGMEDGRMNTPSTTGGNWTFRLLSGELETKKDYLTNLTKQ
ncbi:MAG: 4-alpha-glucanotransferase [Clostridia bacterium]|nr:4-alpha-glucanotransferase [Clostridia bacterium]